MQPVAPNRAPSGPVHVDEERQRRLDDRFVRPHANVALSLSLLDDDELEQIEMLQSRHARELELSR